MRFKSFLKESPYERKQKAMVVSLSQHYRKYITGMRENNKVRMQNAKKKIIEIESILGIPGPGGRL